jgi:hypothetical protein
MTKALGAYSCAGGYQSQTAEEYQFAYGNNVVLNKKTTEAATAFGTYNNPDSKALFMIGNGSSSHRQNAFEVYEDGHVEVQGMGTTDNSITTKKYVDNLIKSYLVVSSTQPNAEDYPEGALWICPIS